MALTVRDLTEIPFLRTRLHAGAAGADRTVTWAHSCETASPWEWLDKGDLLMTVGLGIPSDAQEQVAYIESLAAVQISGIAIGEHMHAPELSSEMLAAADRRGLPILLTAFEVPFIQIGRMVAAASNGPEYLRLVKTMRVYDSVRAAAVRSSGPAELMSILGEEVDCDLHVCTNDRALGLFEGARPPRQAVIEKLVSETARRSNGSMPGILRLMVDGRMALVVPVPARRPASLVAEPRGSEAPPYAILQHVATVAALEYERLIAAREQRRRLGGETLAGLLDARIAPHLAVPHLESHGLGTEPMVVMMVAPAGAWSSGFHQCLAERGIPHMLLRREDVLFCLIPAASAIQDEMTEVIPDGSRIGVSDPFSDLALLQGAVREARWALEVAGPESGRISRYGSRIASGAPRSIAEARTIVDRVLGPLIEYDRERGTELVESLAAFLRCNRSWQSAADELFIHKQTLVYRLRRVEEITDRKLNQTASIAELWIAISALGLLD
jgi:purine catabolism regulator